MRRPAIHSGTASPSPNGWPPVVISYSDRGKARRLDPQRHARAMEILEAAARTSDIHPWEFLAHEFFLQGTKPPTDASGDIYPPVARACRELLVKRRDVIPHVHVRFKMAHARLTTCYRSCVGPNMGIQIFLDDAAGVDVGDLPLPRLLSHGRDRITTALVEQMAQGETWAATVLARCGHAA